MFDFPYILYSLLHLNFSWMNCFLLSEFVRKVLLGLTAGTLACCVNIPFDVAKSRSAPRGISGIKLLQFQIPICISLFSIDYLYIDKILKIKDCIIYTVQCTLDLDHMLANKQRGIGLYNTAGSGQRKCTKTPRYIRNTAQSKTPRYIYT